MSDLLTIEQVAQRLQVSKRTVRRAIDTRGLRAIQVAGRDTWRVRTVDLEDWLEERTSDRPAVPAATVAAVPAAVAAIAPRPARRHSSGRLAVTRDMGRTA